MLPSLPNFPRTSSTTLDTLIILAWVTGAIIFSLVAWRNAAKKPASGSADAILAGMPKIFMEGPLVEVFHRLDTITDIVRDTRNAVKETQDHVATIERRVKRIGAIQDEQVEDADADRDDQSGRNDRQRDTRAERTKRNDR